MVPARLAQQVVFYFLLFCSCLFSKMGIATDLVYTFKPVFNRSSVSLYIELAFRADNRKKTTLIAPERCFGESNLSKQISNIQLLSRGSLSCQAGKWVIVHEPHQEIRLRYYLTQDWPLTTFERHRAYIQKNYMKCSVAAGLIVPEYFSRSIKVTYQFVGFPDNWFTLSSFGTSRVHTYQGKPQALKNAFILVGNPAVARLHVVPLDNQHVLHVVLHGKFLFTDDQACAILKQIISYQRAFFNDFDFPCYSISILNSINTGSPDSWNVGGSCFHNAFDIFCSAQAPLKSFKKLCAHEHFHTWNGNKINASSEEGLHWFLEGFTEYYTFITALRSQLITFDEFLEYANDIFRMYYTSPVIHALNSRIASEFWRNPDINKLPYHRGFIFALLVNYKIKKQTHNQYSLDHVIKDLWSHSQKTNEHFSIELLERLIRTYVPTGIMHEYSEYIVNGKSFPFMPTLLGPAMSCRIAQLGVYDLGFDFERLQRAHVISQVNSESNAYKAGLRNGQQVYGWSISFERAKEALIKLRDRDIRFFPQKPPFVSLPEYYITPAQKTAAQAWWLS
jgi:hypothetical protein